MDTAFNQTQNFFDQNTNGVDVEAKLRIPQTGFGDLTFTYNATYIFQQEQKVTFIPGQQWTLDGRRVHDPSGRCSAIATTSQVRGNTGRGPSTLGNNFSSGYDDEIPNPDGSVRHVDSWGTWDLYTRWTGIKNLALVAGITNLFNNTPPTTNQVDNTSSAATTPRSSALWVGFTT